MQADFLDAHYRHWEDAERLFQAQSWANADHLYGFAAECGLKGLMLAFGMPYDAIKDRPRNEDDRKHADAIWVRFESYRSGHVAGSGYVPAVVGNPFSLWSASQRYAHRSNFDVVRATGHRGGADAVRDLVAKAQTEGLC